MIAEWAGQYVGVPWKEKGRDPEGWDCWGLVRWIQLKHYGHSLPQFRGEYTDATDGLEIASLIDVSRPILNVQRVSDPQDGDLVLMAFLGQLCHIGIYAGDCRVLHVLPRIDTVLDRTDGIRNARRVEGYYRVV
jgi:cell wall-associated NlpC family hydrolase